MATMIPNDIADFNTDGERRFYQFLAGAAKPDSKHVAWYLPDIEGKEPDFILFSDEVGLVIFEVNVFSGTSFSSSVSLVRHSRVGLRQQLEAKP